MRKFIVFLVAAAACFGQQKIAADRIAAMKADLNGQIDGMKKQAQVMTDTVFSFGELGFQEFETSKYLTNLLEKEGFKIQRGVAGIPTAFTATWGSGKPVIALKRTFNPAGVSVADGKTMVLLSQFPIRGRDDAPPQRREDRGAAPKPGIDDEIPF